ncbi:MAG TPA: alpha/beta fold hydrolase [Candidimonas sp.]|nr:alpha/beta fold hydrolase [Candidimonas sp.]
MIRAIRIGAVIVGAFIMAGLGGCATTSSSSTPSNGMGVVIMHGKGGSPTRHVSSLASSLQGKGYAVANVQMPWSGTRNYDVDVASAEKEIDAALVDLRSRGAKTLFVAGHSQGGVFALHYGSKHRVDGIIAMAPGGDVGSPTFVGKLGPSVQLARKMVAEGQGAVKEKFFDYEGSKGLTPITTTAAIYLDWFDPDGAMNHGIAARNMDPQTPVLHVAPTGDYKGLLRTKQAMFHSLPRHALTKLYEPNASHLGAPSASADEIVRWTTAVASKPGS